ncbi:hypothetical protein [Methylorubrum sp. POS3]|uniref:hypothetical protein n=1 Tax=Methylorubrum sp. POS3 TaxID=2998492 RepID=UPI003726DC21
MLWAMRRVQQNEVRSIERLFRDQATSLDLGNQMLLVAVNEHPMVRLWVALPDYDLLEAYYGFDRCKRSDMPVAPYLIAGCSRLFGSVFHAL